MENFKIREALDNANEKSEKKINMIDLGRELWPEASTRQQQMNISKLMNGQRTSVKTEHVPIICKVLRCDANFLFNIKPV